MKKIYNAPAILFQPLDQKDILTLSDNFVDASEIFGEKA